MKIRSSQQKLHSIEYSQPLFNKQKEKNEMDPLLSGSVPVYFTQVAYDYGKLEKYYEGQGSDVSDSEDKREFPDELWFREGSGRCQGTSFVFGEFFKRHLHYERGNIKMDALQSDKQFVVQVVKTKKLSVDTVMQLSGSDYARKIVGFRSIWSDRAIRFVVTLPGHTQSELLKKAMDKQFIFVQVV